MAPIGPLPGGRDADLRGRPLWVLGIVVALVLIRLGLRLFGAGNSASGHGFTWVLILAIVLVLVRIGLRFYRRR